MMKTQSIVHPVRLGNQPLYAFLVQFPVVCFVGTLLSDVAYWRTNLFIWETFSVWLVTAGCVTAGLTGIVGLVCFLGDRRARGWRFAWPHALTSLFAALLSVVNAFVHSRDGYTAVVPDGLILSVLVVLLMALTAGMGWHRTESVARVGVVA